MSSRVPELDVLHERLTVAREQDRRKPTRLRYLSRPALAIAILLATAVPAVATRDIWVPLVGGETAVPPQAPTRTLVASGDSDAGPWRLEGYRARLRAGGIGDCLFITAGGNGAGACAPADQRSFVATHRAGPVTFVLAGVGSRARTVTVRWADGRRQRARTRDAVLRGGGRVRFALLQRSGGRGGPPALASVKATAP